MRGYKKIIASLAAALVVASGLALAGVSSQAAIVDPRTDATTLAFPAGNIISDANFFDSNAMTENEIQHFLATMVGGCENEYCLAIYRVDTPNRTLSFGTCQPYPGVTAEAASAIIYKVQKLCGLSAKAILVTLQKEQGLVTNSAPTARNIRSAMGYGCPDTSDCDAAYYGLFNQIYVAARQITWYGNPESSFYQGGRYRVGSTVQVQYNPNSDCGSGGVLIENKATAALYFYTPYQPNQSALNAGWNASSDPCSSYGNRNFWNYYNNWFGDPHSINPTVSNPPASRIAGVDRYATAAEISKASFTGKVTSLFIVSGEEFADSASIGAVAAGWHVPVLLTTAGRLPEATRAEIVRLDPDRIDIVGGAASISAAVEAELAQLASVRRFSGQNRFDTSQKLLDEIYGTANTVLLATGLGFPDALAASASAGARGNPVLLVPGNYSAVDSGTKAALTKANARVIKVVGGVSSISAGFESSLRDLGYEVQRIAGFDRAATSIALASDTYSSFDRAFLASGNEFSDALAVSGVAGYSQTPLFITPSRDCIPANVLTELRKASSVVLIGGTGSLSDQVMSYRQC